ncbi:MAG: hypothetical protein HY403_11605 [Elusimicrobia bacterium]|nr:hypothetical protein [Elusimicrobiota bacterium]
MAADPKAPQSAEASDPRFFFREFLAASAVCGLFIGWYFHAPLLSRQVAFGSPVTEVLKYVTEGQYQTFPARVVIAKFIRRGVFPAWTPHAQGGTPLIGKMGPGVFSPFNLPYYLFSESRPHSLAIALGALKFYFGFIFLYLFARLLGVGWFGSVFAALSFVTVTRFHGFIDGGLPTSALFVPLLLLLSELYFHGKRRLSLLLLPWACALAFLGGHFEVSFLANLMAVVYFAARLRGAPASSFPGKLRDLSAFAGAMLGGACLCGFYLMAGQEYVRDSYTTVWRSLPDYGWHYHVIAKHLTWEDFPVAFWGAALALLSVWLLKSLPTSWREGSWRRRSGHCVLAAAVLGAAMALLANLGLDLSFLMIGTHAQDGGLVLRAADLLFVFLALWAWGTSESPALRILGWLMLALLLVRFKLPPLTNGMIQLPFFKTFNNNDYHFTFDAAAGVLCGAAFDRLRLLFREDGARRRAAAGLAFGFLGVLLAAVAAAGPLEGLAARSFSTGVVLPPRSSGPTPPPGGIMGPERVRTFSRSRTFAGWVPSYPPASSIRVGFLENDQLSGAVEAKRQLPCASGRCYFNAEMLLPAPPADATTAAVVDYGPGRQLAYYGPIVSAMRLGHGRWAEAVLAAIVALFALVFWLPPRLLGVLYLGLVAAWCQPIATAAWPADEASYSLPGADKIKEDPELFRVGGFDLKFLHADFLNMYGLSDFRTGGDNLDVFSMIEFSRLCYNFLGNRGDLKSMDLGLRLLGLANVRYLLSPSAEAVEHPGLEAVYQGRDMRVYRNRRAMPRAVFFDQYIHIPLKAGDLAKPDVESRILGGILGAVAQGALDPARTVLLHDLPAPAAAAAEPARSSAASVIVREYEADRVLLDVDAPHPGFVFLSDNHFPGWRAFVDGRPAAILRSWISFRAVAVPGGKSVVEFFYRPVFAGLPLLVSVLSCGAWFVLFLRYRDEPAAPAPSRKASAAAPKAPSPAPEAGECARMTRLLCLALIVPVLLFWLVWAGFVYRGAGVNRAARLSLAAGLVFWGHSLRRRANALELPAGKR